MTDEQIKQNAEVYVTKVTESLIEKRPAYIRAYNAYISGAHSRDDEVEMLKNQIEELSEQLKMNAENIQKLRNPWISVGDRLPEEDPDDKGYSVEVIGLFPDGCVSKCFCSLDEDIWFIEGILIDRPTHWMPIPKV